MEFERRIQLISPDLIIDEKPNSDLIFSILNEAQDRYVMMNYVGDDQMETETNIHTRNTDSIKSLLVEKELTATGTTLNGFTRYRLPYVSTEEYFLYVHSFSKVKGTYKQYKDFVRVDNQLVKYRDLGKFIKTAYNTPIVRQPAVALVSDPTTTDIEYWLMAGLDKFIKTRYSGINFKQTGFEQDQKRIDDLRTLVTRKSYQFNTYPEEYTVTLPDDYMFTVGETAVIFSYDHCWPVGPSGQPRTKNTDVLEATVENIDRQRQNTLSEYRLHGRSARPLRLYEGNEIHLYTDGNYNIRNYILTYLRTPKRISLTDAPFDEYTDMPAATHNEIVKLAVELYLENKANPRYQSYMNEVSTME